MSWKALLLLLLLLFMVSLQLTFLRHSLSTCSTSSLKQGLHVTHTFLAVLILTEMLSQSTQQLCGNVSLQHLIPVILIHAVFLTPCFLPLKKPSSTSDA